MVCVRAAETITAPVKIVYGEENDFIKNVLDNQF